MPFTVDVIQQQIKTNQITSEKNTYDYVRPRIRSGDLLAFSHGDWSSFQGILVNGVRVFCKSTYSHVGVAWVIKNRVFVIEAVVPMVRNFPLSLSGDFYWLPTGAPWLDETEEYAVSTIGTPYKRWDAIRGYFEPLEDGNVHECASLAREILKRDGIDLGPMSRPDSVVQAAQDKLFPMYRISNPRLTLEDF